MTNTTVQKTRPFGICNEVLDLDDVTTTINTYVNVYSWDTEFLQGKVLRFSAATNDLHVKILGSVDGGATYPITAESEFTVAVATPVVKRISNYFSFLKIQVKPAVAGAHGTLTVTGSGSSIPDFSDVEVTVAPAVIISSSVLPTGAATSALQTTGNNSLAVIAGCFTSPTPINISFASGDPQTIIAAPGLGYRIRITSIFWSSSFNMNIVMKDGLSTIGTMFGQTFSKDYITPLALSNNSAFIFDAVSADQVYGQVCYYVEAV